MPTTFFNSSSASAAQQMQPGSVRGRDAPQAKSATSLTLAAMSLGYGVVQLDVTIVNTALNSIGTSLGGGVSELQWVVSTYTIAFAALILTAGTLGDRIGAKKIFMAGFSIFTTASLACALAPTSDRGARGAGSRRGDPCSELARASQPRLSERQGARARRRILGGRRKSCAHRGAAGRRRLQRQMRSARPIQAQLRETFCAFSLSSRARWLRAF